MSMAYPPILPLSEVQFLIQTLRDRTVSENKVKFFKSLWLVQGHLQKIVVGEDPDIAESSLFGGVQPAVNSDLKQLATELHQIQKDTQFATQYGSLRPGKLGDGTILKLLLEYAPQIISLIMLILDEVDTDTEDEDEDPTPAVG